MASRDIIRTGQPTHFRVNLDKIPTTCDLCKSRAGRILPISRFAQGKTAPPFHPNCRCYVEILDARGNVFAVIPAGAAEWARAADEISYPYVAAREYLERGGAQVRWLGNLLCGRNKLCPC
ncbi:MAG: hypothetical protein LBE35_06775 [Clostridiales bacterium]|nr:hypothetical protein [Clostridiales bacterium]